MSIRRADDQSQHGAEREAIDLADGSGGGVGTGHHDQVARRHDEHAVSADAGSSRHWPHRTGASRRLNASLAAAAKL
jgi:hypothetical protein